MIALVPGALVVVFSFHAGGFFPGIAGLVAVGFLLLLILRITLAEHPFVGLSVPYLAGTGLIALFALWTLISSIWSDAPARALIEYDRALLYLLAFVLFGAEGYVPQRLRWMVRGLVLGIFVVCLCAFVTRVAPDVWAVSTRVSPARLSYPLTYSNALGVLTALGIIMSFALTSDPREPSVVRVLTAVALPVLAATLLLTFSRGAIAACALGLLAVVLVGRPAALLSGVLAAVPAGAFAVASAYGAELLGTDHPTTAAAATQGHDVALVVALCALGAGLVRGGLLRFDDRLGRARLPGRLGRPAVLAPAVGAGVAIALALGVWGSIERQYDLFVQGNVLSHEEQRARLTDPGNNGRLDMWRVAVDTFRADRLLGQGAGTYPLAWDRRRPVTRQIEDGHSLYLEVLAELGVVGLLLLTGAVVLVLGGLLERARARSNPDRVVTAGLFAAALTWAVHAGIDWDWEMPAVTLWVFAAGGMALAAVPATTDFAGGAHDAARGIPRGARVAVALGCLIVSLVPARIFLSDIALRESRDALADRDCPRAIDRALDSIAILGVRSDAYAVLGYCDVRLGRPHLGVRALSNAATRDPGNWEFRYGLALVRGAAGLDPRPAARRAQLLNPREQLARDAVRRFATNDPQVWRRRALTARLPTE